VKIRAPGRDGELLRVNGRASARGLVAVSSCWLREFVNRGTTRHRESRGGREHAAAPISAKAIDVRRRHGCWIHLLQSFDNVRDGVDPVSTRVFQILDSGDEEPQDADSV